MSAAILVATSLVLLTWSVQSDAAVQSAWAKATLTIDIAVDNPGSSMTLQEIGVESRLDAGKFTCLSAAGPLATLAHYHVPFLVARMGSPAGATVTTMKPADPPLSVPHETTARFDVSLYPNATGACGAWSAHVRLVMKFSGAKELRSQWYAITSADLDAVVRRTTLPELARAAVCSSDDSVYRYWFEDRFVSANEQDQVRFLHAMDSWTPATLLPCRPEHLKRLSEWVEAIVDQGDEDVVRGLAARLGARLGFGNLRPLLQRVIGESTSEQHELAFVLCVAWKDLNGATGKSRQDNLPAKCSTQ